MCAGLMLSRWAVEAGVEREGKGVRVVGPEDVFAPPTDEEMERAEAALGLNDRWYKPKDGRPWTDWNVVRLMFSRGVSVKDVCEHFKIPNRTLGDRIKRDEWNPRASDAMLRVMAREAYVFALAHRERDGASAGGEAAIRASLDWRALPRPGMTVAEPYTGERKLKPGEDWRDRDGDHHLPECKACADRQEVARVSSKLEEVALAMEQQVAEASPEAAAFLRTLRLSTQGLLSDPGEHLDAEGKLREWGEGYSVSGRLPGLNA